MAGRPVDDVKRRANRLKNGAVRVTLGNNAEGFPRALYQEAQILAILNKTTVTHVFQVAMLEYLNNHKKK